MTFLVAAVSLILFFIIYITIASAIFYHLNAYSLPEWRGRRIAIIVFVCLSLALGLVAIYYFFQVPWEAYTQNAFFAQ